MIKCANCGKETKEKDMGRNRVFCSDECTKNNAERKALDKLNKQLKQSFIGESINVTY